MRRERTEERAFNGGYDGCRVVERCGGAATKQ